MFLKFDTAMLLKGPLLTGIALLFVFSAAAQEQRVPLFEVFTSATSPPCNAGNANYETILSSKPSNEYVSIKYQQNLIQDGDPYCTDETVERRASFYGVNSIPHMKIDGGWNQTAQAFTNIDYVQSRNTLSGYKLSGHYSISNKTITAKIYFTPLIPNTTGSRIYVAIVETHTDSNKRSNGETRFYNVVKKMLPTATGSIINNTTVGNDDTIVVNYTFNGNYRLPVNGAAINRINHAIEHSVENFDNLRVVAWIQGSDKTVHQAANLVPYRTGIPSVSNNIQTCSLSPNPAQNTVNIRLEMKNRDRITASLVNMQGITAIRKSADLVNGINTINLDTQYLPEGIYTMIITDSQSNSMTRKITVMH